MFLHILTIGTYCSYQLDKSFQRKSRRRLPAAWLATLLPLLIFAVQRIGRRTCDQEVAVSTSIEVRLRNNSGQLVYTVVAPQPSSIMWCRSMGGDFASGKVTVGLMLHLSWVTCNSWRVQHQTYGYLPTRRKSPPLTGTTLYCLVAGPQWCKQAALSCRRQSSNHYGLKACRKGRWTSRLCCHRRTAWVAAWFIGSALVSINEATLR